MLDSITTSFILAFMTSINCFETQRTRLGGGEADVNIRQCLSLKSAKN